MKKRMISLLLVTALLFASTALAYTGEGNDNIIEVSYNQSQINQKENTSIIANIKSLQNSSVLSDQDITAAIVEDVLFAKNRIENAYLECPLESIMQNLGYDKDNNDNISFFLEKAILLKTMRSTLGMQISDISLKYTFNEMNISKDSASMDVTETYEFQISTIESKSVTQTEYHIELQKNYLNEWCIISIISNDWLDRAYDNRPFDFESALNEMINGEDVPIEPESYDQRISLCSTTTDYTVSGYNVVRYADTFWSSYNGLFSNYGNVDCMNFASQCLWAGLGGSNDETAIDNYDKPMDNSGTYLWKKDVVYWTSCSNFRSYLSNNTSESGLYGSTAYDNFNSVTIGTIIHGPGNVPYGHACIVVNPGNLTRSTIEVSAHSSNQYHVSISYLFGTSSVAVNTVTAYKTVSTCSHSYSSISPASDGTDGTCNSCDYERLRIRVNALAPCSANTSKTISGLATINCYRMSASVTSPSGTVTWLGNAYNTSSYSTTYTFPSAGLYKVTIYGRDLNTTYATSINRSCSYYVRVS